MRRPCVEQTSCQYIKLAGNCPPLPGRSIDQLIELTIYHSIECKHSVDDMLPDRYRGRCLSEGIYPKNVGAGEYVYIDA